jgi:hypothetical protein
MAIDSVTAATIRRRLKNIREWIDAEAPYLPGDQRHLDANTPERAYWHYGYQAALADVLNLVEARVSRKSGNADRSN